jgi:hypothetical protein
MASMRADEVWWRLLVSAGEDYQSLNEALWEFGLPDHATAGAPDVATVKATLRRLVADGLVRLYWCAEVYGDVTPVPADEQLAVLDDERHWRVPQQGETGVRYTTTPAGDEALRQRPAGVPEARGGR